MESLEISIFSGVSGNLSFRFSNVISCSSSVGACVAFLIVDCSVFGFALTVFVSAALRRQLSTLGLFPHFDVNVVKPFSLLLLLSKYHSPLLELSVNSEGSSF